MAGAHAAEIDVIATGAVSGAFKRIVTDFERDTHHHLHISWGPSLGSSPEAIPVRIEKGERADVLVMVGSEMDKLIRKGRFVAATRADLAQSGIGVGVKAGSAKPDIASVASLRQALLDARSIGYSEGASGTYIANSLLKRLDVVDQVVAKRKLIPGKELVGEAIARGEVELGLQQISELRVVPGVTYVGPLPAELQKISVLAAAVSEQAREPDAARAFLKYLSTASAAKAFEDSGLDLPSPAAAPVENHLVRRGDVQIEVLAQGQGPVVVMLPSLGRSGRDFDAVSARLAAAGMRVLRPEPRGVGRSVGPLDGLTMHDFAADVAAVCDAEKTGPVVVVGHAWGSQPARMLAVDRPDLVRGVVMAAASAGKLMPGSTEKPYGRLRQAIDGSGDLSLPDAQRLQYLQQAFFAPGHDPSEWLDGWYPANHHAEAHARDVTPIDDYFAGGTVPILDLQAEHDAVVVPGVMKAILGERVTVVTIPDAGHALAPEQPKAMSDAIVAFSRRVDANPR